MVDPRFPYVLGVTFDISVAGPARIYNRTTGNVLKVEVEGDGIVIVDLANMTDAISDGDVIEAVTTGVNSGFGTITVDLPEGGQKLSVSEKAMDTGTKGVSI